MHSSALGPEVKAVPGLMGALMFTFDVVLAYLLARIPHSPLSRAGLLAVEFVRWITDLLEQLTWSWTQPIDRDLLEH